MSIEKRDWRLQGISELAKEFRSPTGAVHPVGSIVTLSGTVRFGGDICDVLVPNAPSLLLSLGWRLGQQAKDSLINTILPNCRIFSGTRIIENALEGAFFDCLENLMGCVVFSYTALEAFANTSIPDGYEYRAIRNDGRLTETYNKEQAERWLKLQVKYDKLLPDIRSVKSPKGTAIWQDYRWLEELRDRFIHLKSADLKPSGPEQVADYAWSLILDEKVPRAQSIAKALILHYYPVDAPRWLTKCPVT